MKLHQDQNFERVLESAVVASWADLMRGRQNGLIHIEYGFAASGTLDHLQVWSSITRGYWLLACSYWMSASKLHDSGVHFDNGSHSAGLARYLPLVMPHTHAFACLHSLSRRRLHVLTTTNATELD